jgi:hypothetical protein
VWKEEKAFTGFTQFSYPEYRGSKLLWYIEPLYNTAILIFHHRKDNLRSYLRILSYFLRICFWGIWLM